MHKLCSSGSRSFNLHTHTKNTCNREIRYYCPSSFILDIHIQNTAISYTWQWHHVTSRDITDLVYGGGIGGHVTSLTWYMVGVLGVTWHHWPGIWWGYWGSGSGPGMCPAPVCVRPSHLWTTHDCSYTEEWIPSTLRTTILTFHKLLQVLQSLCHTYTHVHTCTCTCMYMYMYTTLCLVRDAEVSRKE